MFESLIRKQPTLKHSEAYEHMKGKCGLLLNWTLIIRPLGEARKIVEGDEIAQYGRLWNYAGKLLASNPGSSVQVGVILIPDSPL